jgi:xanthine/uracil permease
VSEPWFRYTRTAGRITAAPVNAKGWIALSGAVLLPMIIMSIFRPVLMRVHPILFGLVLFLVIGGTILALIRLVIAKGSSSG